ncbi:MAG: NADPH-dependent oxidoreductase [Tissierellia bacterium]|nr:NADPH-dependent oxidoreductase [Tissierellia bacterium]
MNNTIKHQLNHRSIREFTEEPLTEEERQTLLAVANQTATSTGMQMYSIIRITDLEKRKAIAKVCGQEYAARATELWIYVVDCFRNGTIAREQGVDIPAISDEDRFFQGFTDGALAAQNVTVAAESMGLGAVYFGSILNDAEKIIEILELPELTFPIVGQGIGHPNQEPQLKPRMPLEYKVFENTYKVFDNYLEEMKEYDKELNTYYDLRDANRRVDTFTDQVVGKLKADLPKRAQLIKIAEGQGFTFSNK